MEQIRSRMWDDGIEIAEGKPNADDQLFRRYFLNRRLEDFECGSRMLVPFPRPVRMSL